MTVEQIMKDLEKMGTETVKKIFINHGAKEPLFGVKVGDLKKSKRKSKRTTNFPYNFTKREMRTRCISQDSWLTKDKFKKRPAILGKKRGFSDD